MKNSYFKKSVKSLGHTPIYKMHKYFARRPHNVFRELIEYYSDSNDVIFDPFGGGGVTLVEGLTTNRKVIISDVNPIASFVQKNQVSNVDFARLTEIVDDIVLHTKSQYQVFYTTECDKCSSSNSHVRWFEHAYTVDCPDCGCNTLLNNESKFIKLDGKPKNGFYKCQNCDTQFKAVDTPRTGSKILNIRYRCLDCGHQDTKSPTPCDLNKFQKLIDEFDIHVKNNKLSLPEKSIPSEWDRQQEDCLHRKGIKTFSDFFTKRNLLCCSYMFSVLDKQKKSLSIQEYEYTAFLLSSLLRYTNNMTFSTSSWMDGRPVAWAKHAYWTPNQFIETNPFEYLENRMKAFKSAIKDRDSRFNGKTFSSNPTDILNSKAEYCVKCIDSSQIDLPENSIDFVLTDPPYGSNVQYGELCEFWSAWIEDINPFQAPDLTMSREAVVHRKTKASNYAKDFSDYYELLLSIFRKCYFILKPEGKLAFTFNNKNIGAWYAVIKATIDAGFFIEPEGIFYQEGIEAYRDTAHLRFDGTPQGDFIYTFSKSERKIDFSSISESFADAMEQTLSKITKNKDSFTLGEFYIDLFRISTLCLIKQISEGKSEKEINSEFSHIFIEKFLESQPNLRKEGSRWRLIGGAK